MYLSIAAIDVKWIKNEQRNMFDNLGEISHVGSKADGTPTNAPRKEKSFK